MSPLTELIGSAKGYGWGSAIGAIPAFDSIASIDATGSSGSVTFSNIPQIYQHLQIRCVMFGDTFNQSSPTVRFNSDANTNYVNQFVAANGSSAYVGSSTSTTIIGIGSNNSPLQSATPTVAIVDIHDYASTTKFKTLKSYGGIESNNNGTETIIHSGLWRSQSSITSITIQALGQNWTNNSRFSLYGIRAG